MIVREFVAPDNLAGAEVASIGIAGDGAGVEIILRDVDYWHEFRVIDNPGPVSVSRLTVFSRPNAASASDIVVSQRWGCVQANRSQSICGSNEIGLENGPVFFAFTFPNNRPIGEIKPERVLAKDHVFTVSFDGIIGNEKTIQSGWFKCYYI